MKRLIPLRIVAQQLGSYSPDYVRQIAADQGRPPNERKFPAETHAHWPPFVQDGPARRWFASEQHVIALEQKRNRKLESSL